MTPQRRRVSQLLRLAISWRDRGWPGKALDVIEAALAREHDRGYTDAHEHQMRMRVMDAMQRK